MYAREHCGGVCMWKCVQCGKVCNVEVCAMWRCVHVEVWQCGRVCNVGVCAKWKSVQCGGVYNVEECAMWKSVQCGGVCNVEVCTMWKSVQCGGTCYQCFFHATLGLSEEGEVGGGCQTLKVWLHSAVQPV